MSRFYLRDDFIKLGQVLKAQRLVDSGAEAKEVILEGRVKVNGETCLMRGKKLVEGDVVSYSGETIEIARP